MKHHHRGGGRGHQGPIDAMAGERGAALIGLLFLAHAHPDVGEEHVGSAGGLARIVDHPDLAASGARSFDLARGWAVAGRAGEREVQSEQAGGLDP
jgi:hypothetical protein